MKRIFYTLFVLQSLCGGLGVQNAGATSVPSGTAPLPGAGAVSVAITAPMSPQVPAVLPQQLEPVLSVPAVNALSIAPQPTPALPVDGNSGQVSPAAGGSVQISASIPSAVQSPQGTQVANSVPATSALMNPLPTAQQPFVSAPAMANTQMPPISAAQPAPGFASSAVAKNHTNTTHAHIHKSGDDLDDDDEDEDEDDADDDSAVSGHPSGSPAAKNNASNGSLDKGDSVFLREVHQYHNKLESHEPELAKQQNVSAGKMLSDQGDNNRRAMNQDTEDSSLSLGNVLKGAIAFGAKTVQKDRKKEKAEKARQKKKKAKDDDDDEDDDDEDEDDDSNY